MPIFIDICSIKMYFYLLGIVQEFSVIINLYNGDLLPFITSDIEYSLVDIIILLSMLLFVKFKKNKYIDRIDWILSILCLFSHFQWYVHNPFSNWPEWWIGDKSPTDYRHRTEYYDTHVMCFCIWLILFIRCYDKQNNSKNILPN